MWKLFPAFLLLLAAPRFGAQSGVQPDPEQARILSLENAWNQAVQQKDTAALQLLLSPDLVYVEYDGTLMGKAPYMAGILSPAQRPERVVSESMTVHLYGSVAVVNGMYLENGVRKGKPYALRERFTDTWVRHGNTWMCVASQSTLIGQ
jgi:ketosteroid isomerase-like protein